MKEMEEQQFILKPATIILVLGKDRSIFYRIRKMIEWVITGEAEFDPK